jgi:hypothetical protein
MTTSSTETSSRSTRSGKLGRGAGEDATASSRPRATTRKPLKGAQPVPQARGTKHAQLLSLLSRPEGATIEDMMQATNWQQHSVRGFLAGTVRKRLGLALTSSKSGGEARRYRIVARRGR